MEYLCLLNASICNEEVVNGGLGLTFLSFVVIDLTLSELGNLTKSEVASNSDLSKTSSSLIKSSLTLISLSNVPSIVQYSSGTKARTFFSLSTINFKVTD